MFLYNVGMKRFDSSLRDFDSLTPTRKHKIEREGSRDQRPYIWDASDFHLYDDEMACDERTGLGQIRGKFYIVSGTYTMPA